VLQPPAYSGPPDVLAAAVADLLPHTAYSAALAVTTAAGTFLGRATAFRTAAAAPTGVRPVVVARVAARGVEVWVPQPVRPNGHPLNYTLAVTGGDGAAFELPLGTGPGVLPVTVPAPPHTLLHVVVRACTPAGCTASAAVRARTLAEPPAGVQTAAVDGVAGAVALPLFWAPPLQPYGAVLQYRLLVDGVQVYAGAAARTALPGLRPHTGYNVTVHACNIAGCAAGPTIALWTAQAPPGPLQAPTAVVVDARTVTLAWPPVAAPHGILAPFLVLRDGGVIGAAPALALSYRAGGLRPFRNYTFAYAASTAGGTTRSPEVRVATPAAPPEGMGAARAVASGQTVAVSWDAPAQPNGVLAAYRVHRMDDVQLAEAEAEAAASSNGTAAGAPIDAGRLVFRGGAGTTTVIDQALSPHTTYYYAVAAENQAGIGYRQDMRCALICSHLGYGGCCLPARLIAAPPALPPSPPPPPCCHPTGSGAVARTRVTTDEAAPAGMASPSAEAAGATAISVRWLPPAAPNGAILTYLLEARQTEVSFFWGWGGLLLAPFARTPFPPLPIWRPRPN